tara:strand:- start:2288 stop:3265 length:978 start_codon:yes stop_codon:yes gene_type:complete
MKKLLYITLLFIATALTFQLRAQQLSANSQYLMNSYTLNTATAGLEPGFEVASSYRKQWAGFNDAPSTFYFSAHAAINRPQEKVKVKGIRSYRFIKAKVLEKKLYHAVGGYVVRDVAGAYLTTSSKGSYTLNIPLNQHWRLASSLALGFTRFELDQSKINLIDPNDPQYINYQLNGTSKTVFDGSFALWLSTYNFFAGYSAEQLFQNSIVSESVGEAGQLNFHHFLTAGYSIEFNKDVVLLPSVLVRYTDPAPTSFDVSIQAEYQEKFWLGLSYRHESAVVILGGLNIKDFMKVGYSYDYPTTDIAKYSSGSHEFFVSIYGLMMR